MGTSVEEATMKLLSRRNFLINKKWEEGLTTFEELELYALQLELNEIPPKD